MTVFFWDGSKRRKGEDRTTTRQLYRIIDHITYITGRIAGIEPASSPWQREILPFDHIRNFFIFCIQEV